jgi:hypothetical protein
MGSLYDELAAKLSAASQAPRRQAAKADIAMLLYARRDALRELWLAAEQDASSPGAEGLSRLNNAIEALRPLFGERASP